MCDKKDHDGEITRMHKVYRNLCSEYRARPRVRDWGWPMAPVYAPPTTVLVANAKSTTWIYGANDATYIGSSATLTHSIWCCMRGFGGVLYDEPSWISGWSQPCFNTCLAFRDGENVPSGIVHRRGQGDFFLTYDEGPHSQMVGYCSNLRGEFKDSEGLDTLRQHS